MRRGLLIGGVVLFVASTVFVVVLALQSRSTSNNSVNNTQVATPAIRAKPSRPEELLAVDAAANALNKLRFSVLMSRFDRTKVVHRYVTRSRWKAVQAILDRDTQFTSNRQPLWSQWGYDSRLLAMVRSHYTVTTKMYRVVKFRPGYARVALYLVRSWYSDGEDNDPTSNQDIRVETMQRKDGRWLFVREALPPQSERPDLQGGSKLSFQEVTNLFKPYLKGFRTYEPPKVAG
jgi:hypothetical protein